MKLNKFIIVLTTIAAMSMTYAKASNTPTNEDVFSSNQTYEEYRDSIQNEYVKYKNDVIARYIAYRDSVLSEFVKHMHKPWDEHKGKPAVPKPIDKSIDPEIVPLTQKVKEEIPQDNTPKVKPILDEGLTVVPQEETIEEPIVTPQPDVAPKQDEKPVSPAPKVEPKEEIVVTSQPKEEPVVVPQPKVKPIKEKTPRKSKEKIKPQPTITPQPEEKPEAPKVEPKEEPVVTPQPDVAPKQDEKPVSPAPQVEPKEEIVVTPQPKEEPVVVPQPKVKPIKEKTPRKSKEKIKPQPTITPQPEEKPEAPKVAPKEEPIVIPQPDVAPKQDTPAPEVEPKEEPIVTPQPDVAPKQDKPAPKVEPKEETVIVKEEKQEVKKDIPNVDPLKGGIKGLKVKEVIELPQVVNAQPKPFVPLVLPKVKPNELDFTFFGTELSVRIDEYCEFKINSIDNKGIANAMEEVVNNELLLVTLDDCLSIRDELQLCDWAYLQMLDEIGKTYFGGACNEATLLTGYLYCMSGYKMRFGYNDKKELIILFASDQFISGIPFISIANDSYRTYYTYNDKEISTVYVCDYAMPSEKNLSLQINDLPLFDDDYKNINLKLHSYPVVLDYSVNKNLIDFYNTYPTPMTEGDFTSKWLYYAHTPLSESAKSSIYPIIIKAIEGKSEYDAVNIIMDWIETYKYEYDNKVWGYDRAFFPDETIFYPNSDCEDHAILFTRIVTDLLGLKTALLYYNSSIGGHLAAAVQFNGNIAGDYIEHKGVKYTVCDPTIYYSKAGRTMKSFKNVAPTLILF